MHLGTQWRLAPVLGPLYPRGTPRRNSLLLASSWPRSGCSHLASKAAFMKTSLSLNRLSNKQFKKQSKIHKTFQISPKPTNYKGNCMLIPFSLCSSYVLWVQIRTPGHQHEVSPSYIFQHCSLKIQGNKLLLNKST